MFDGQAFGQEIVAAVKAHVGRTVEPLLARMEALEKRLGEMPVPQDGPPGRDGKDADPAELERVVRAAVEKLPAARDGKDAEPEAVAAILRADLGRMVREAVAEAVAALPAPKDGRDVDPEEMRQAVALQVKAAVEALPKPQDGRSVTAEDVAPLLREEVAKAVSALPVPKDSVGLAGAVIDRHGALVLTLSDGTQKDLGPVVGKDADPERLASLVRDEAAKIPVPRDGKDGRDGFGFDDMAVEHDGERAIVLRFARGDQTKEFALNIPAVLDRGVWREGASYAKGDAVTWAGSLWIAQEGTAEKPETGHGWRLAVKRGRDGKDGAVATRARPDPIRAGLSARP